MTKINLTIQIDEETKIVFEEFCNEIGLSVSTAFNIFAKTVIKEQRISFESALESPNTITTKAMNEALNET